MLERDRSLAAAVRAAGLTVIVATLVACGPQTAVAPGSSAPGVGAERSAPMAGGPAHAWALYRGKRAPADPGFDVRAAYERAESAIRRMPGHSVARGGVLPRLRAGGQDGGAADELGAWEPLGPGNVGGRTRVLVIDPRRRRTMYAGGVSGGVWRTRNGGKRWHPVGEDMANLTINSMAMHPTDRRTLVVGTGEGYFREEVRGTGLPLRGGGIWRTGDGGDTWEMLPATASDDFHWVNDLVYSPHDGDRIYAATRTGVWRTLDGGTTWLQALRTRVDGGCLDLEIRTDRPGDTLFAACGTFEQATVYRSEDAETGAAFEEVLSDPGMGRTEIAIAPSAQNVVYALAASNRPGPGGNYEQGLHAVFASEADGDPGTWVARVRNDDPVKQNTVLLHNAFAALIDACGEPPEYVPMGWYSNVLAVDPTDPERLFAGSVYVMRSDDGGRNWGLVTALAQSPIHVDHHGLVFDPRYNGGSNRKLYFLNDGGIWRTDDALATPLTFADACTGGRSGYEFVDLNRGYQTTQFYHGVPFPDGSAYLGGTQDNGTLLGTEQTGDRWLHVFGGDGSYAAVDPVDTDVLYVQAQWAFVRKTIDGGANFFAADAGLDPPTVDYLGTDTNYLFITPLLMDPGNRMRLWLGGRRVWRTDDGATSWAPASRPLKRRDKVSAISVAPTDSDLVVVGSDTGRVYRTSSGTTAGSGTRWLTSKPRNGWVTWVTHDPSDADIVYATYGSFGGKHVFRSDDGGRSWSSIDGAGADALPDIPVHALVVDPDDGDRLFLATDRGVFVSVSGGGSWAVENTAFGEIVTESLALLERPDGSAWLYAFTHGRGVWRARIDG